MEHIGTAVIIGFVCFLILVALDEWVKHMNKGTTIDEHFFSAVKEDKEDGSA